MKKNKKPPIPTPPADGYLYSIAVGHINPFMRASREAAKLIVTLPGLYGVHPSERGTLILFRSLNDAKGGRNILESRDAKVGRNICKFRLLPDGVPEFACVCE